MNEEKKRPETPETPNKKNAISLGKIFYHNTFVLAFSFVVAVVTWFLMYANSAERNVVIHDVPITQQVSSAAQEEGLQIFSMSHTTADVEVSGNNLLTSQLSASDFEVSVTLNPTSTQLEGNTLQKMTLQVRAVKANTMGSYEIASVSPSEVTVEYDRVREVNLPIESNIQVRSDTGYYAGTPVLSADNVTISGPASSVDRISRVAVNYQVETALREETSFSCPIRLYDANDQEITDWSGLYLTLNVESVDVTVPVIPMKTVSLVASTLHQPEGFSESRIQIEPAEIAIVGTSEVLSGINEIQLDSVIDFADLTAGTNNTIISDITLPTGVRNISTTGETTSQATVTINLNGYEQASVSVSSANIQVVNAPSGVEPTLATTSLAVSVVGPEAQVTRVTGDSISVQVDLSNFQNQTGTVEVPATVTLTGSLADSCWVVDEYTVSVNIPGVQAAAARTMRTESSEDNVAAAPQR